MFALTRPTIDRARKERLPQVAGSLAFTTFLSIVPVLAVSFALLTRFHESPRGDSVVTAVLPSIR